MFDKTDLILSCLSVALIIIGFIFLYLMFTEVIDGANNDVVLVADQSIEETQMYL
jgi:hypothetical protein